VVGFGDRLIKDDGILNHRQKPEHLFLAFRIFLPNQATKAMKNISANWFQVSRLALQRSTICRKFMSMP
jgi:hypothetical protein